MKALTSGVAMTKESQSKGMRTTLFLLGAVVVAIAAAWAAVALHAPASPSVDAAKLARVASSAEFTSASPEKQRQWMIAMNDRAEQIADAKRSGLLSEPEFRAAMNLAWMAKQEDHMAKYYRLAVGKDREAYLEKLSKKHFGAKDAAKADPNPADAFNHDDVWEQSWIAKWTPEKRAQYEAFRKAMEESRTAWKLANRPKQNKPSTKSQTK